MSLGIPEKITALLFDLDGVLTSTAVLHRQAWRQTFEAMGQPFSEQDYLAYVDGKPRYDGVRSFLTSRGLTPLEDEVRRIGDQKNELVNSIIDEQGITPYPASVDYLKAARAAGMPIGVVTSSANAMRVLRAGNLLDYVDALVDGNVITASNLRGKPAPDSFVEGARRLQTAPGNAAVFEDALAGVQAGHDGGFGFVVGVDRGNQAEALKAGGADVVVDELDELLS
ncbi:haloacid dehalogenase superfamily, subfamily IA, variant 3 with third motif having DD or ED/beta-phosphoglucomutase family hydrolase [Lentzea albidocapillata subsp. violacea]|uniref:Beta-phosphoglucomutase n=1 Tax=Lentzea albidocapillata subsp. violacea TaxID=128104 RepID=A0A1G9TNN8_9PSEU|nr:beta-phosphoglucomutase family hydrolase [Lentzea albidocapillata]SDM49367.1 haloacid dehalogenase superfamily, subfamily IA, variant 3 with third motif having DD or ED/beta-phosphoglucomutase family hydrolase [Lentzea albidocapillata subsp. violacea]